MEKQKISHGSLKSTHEIIENKNKVFCWCKYEWLLKIIKIWFCTRNPSILSKSLDLKTKKTNNFLLICCQRRKILLAIGNNSIVLGCKWYVWLKKSCFSEDFFF